MSIFKQTFRDGVKSQLIARQNAILNRTPSSIQYFNSRNAWIRMTSAVNVNNDDGALAKKYILLGGTLSNVFGTALKSGIGNNALNAYSTVTPGGQTNRLGIRPMPGITSIDVRSKAAYGSLREIVVSFQCWDIRQLEELELLYMRPGYSVLVEWGWNPYLSNSGDLKTNIQFIEDVLNGKKTKEDIWKEIYKKSTTDGNYDAIYGFIKNYSWSARPDGGYDCTTVLITMGEVIESLKINYGAFNVKDIATKGIFGKLSLNEASVSSETIKFNPAYSPSTLNAIRAQGDKFPQAVLNDNIINADSVIEAYSQNKLAGICAELYRMAITKATGKGEAQQYTLMDPSNNNFVYQLLRYNIDIKGQTEPTITEGNKQVYITLESFVEILNKYIIINDGQQSLIKLSVREADSSFGGTGAKLLCLGNINQISTNPAICLIKNDAYLDPEKTLKISNVNTELIKPYLKAIPADFAYIRSNNESDPDAGFGTIGNIYLNLDYLYKLAVNESLASQDKKEKNDIILFDYIKSIMSGVNFAIGNVANFDIFVDPTENNVARIIDVNYVDTTPRKEVYENAFILQMHNLQSVVRNYKLESQIFPDQITTIAIGAQAQGGVLGADVNTLIDFNQNLIDRIVPKKYTWETPSKPDPLEEIKENLSNLQNNWQVVIQSITRPQDSFNNNTRYYDVEQSSKYANSLRDIIAFFTTYLKTNTKNRSIIPTKLSLELDGIGGIIIGTIFRIPDDILPRGYKGGGAGPKQIGYVVTGIGHSIQNNDWVTKIDAQFIILDEPTGLPNSSLELVKAINYAATSPVPVGNVQGTNFAYDPLKVSNVDSADTLEIDFTKFVYPVNGTVTSDFGNRVIAGAGQFHRGLDIANALNTPIYSACYGTVIQIGATGYGDSAVYVEIDKSQYPSKTPLYIVYGHNQSATVKKGDKVIPGQLIAYMGSKGNSTGPHLHLQLQDNLVSNNKSYIFGKYFPQQGGTITALAPWGSIK